MKFLDNCHYTVINVDETKYGLIDKYRARIIFWMNCVSMLIIPAFIVWMLTQQMYAIAVMNIFVLSATIIQNVLIYRGLYSPYIVAFFQIPLIIASLTLGIVERGDSVFYWVHPMILAFYFILPKRFAIASGIIMALIMAPLSFYTMNVEMAFRLTESMIFVIVVSTIFVTVLERQQKILEDKEQQLKENIADASHELRTPLATSLAKVEAMKDGIRPTNPDELASLSKSIDHLSGLVNDLHVLSLTDVSELVLLHEEVDLNDIVLQTLLASENDLNNRNLTIETQLPDNFRVEADPFRVRQIVENLVSNCVRYTNEGGQVFISGQVTDNMASLCVEDSGPGVSDESLAKLFQRYYRIDKTRSREYGGSGMGLPLVKALAKAQKGNAYASHSSHGGLKVDIQLPTYVS